MMDRLLYRLLISSLVFLSLPQIPQLLAAPQRTFMVESYGKNKNAIDRLVSDVNKNQGGRIVFPKNETYYLSIADDPNGGHKLRPQESSILFAFKDCKYLDIDMNGSRIVLKGNHSSKYSIFYFFNCSSFSLRNGSLEGDAMTHNYSPVVFRGKVEKSTHEWGHGIMVLGSKGKISNMTVSYMSGDGIYVASFRSSGKVLDAETEIDSCDIGHCRRNGLSIASNTGFRLSNTSIHHVGSFDGISGTNPKAGIDFEYEDRIGNKGDVLITGCTIRDCEKKLISASNVHVPEVLSLVIDDCVFDGASFQLANLKAEKGKTVRNCRFTCAPMNCGNSIMENCFFDLGPKVHYVHGTTFKKCEFQGTLSNLSKPYGCAIVGNSLATAVFENCIFRDIRGMNDNSPVFQGISGYHFPLSAHFIGCSFQNTSFVKGNSKIKSSFSFDNCTLSKGCKIYNEGGTAVVFRGSTVDNLGSYKTQNGEFSFENCEIIQDDKTVSNPLLYFGTHSIKNSRVKNTLKITPEMRAKGVRKIKYKESK